MSVLVFDTETSDRKEGEIVEAAYIELDIGIDLAGDLNLIPVPLGKRAGAKTFIQRYKPSKPMTMGSIAIHHILPFELENCPPSAEFKLPDDAGTHH